jgi:hypothetical protein
MQGLPAHTAQPIVGILPALPRDLLKEMQGLNAIRLSQKSSAERKLGKLEKIHQSLLKTIQDTGYAYLVNQCATCELYHRKHQVRYCVQCRKQLCLHCNLSATHQSCLG